MFRRITRNAKQMNGQPCIRGMRLTVRRVVAAVAAYPDCEELFRNYPDLEEDDIVQALEFAMKFGTCTPRERSRNENTQAYSGTTNDRERQAGAGLRRGQGRSRL